MTEDPLARLTPADAVATLRSLPRRFSAAFHPGSDDERQDAVDPEELAHRVGPDGRSAAQHLSDVVNGLPLLQHALDQVLTTDDPVLHPQLESLAGQWDGSPTPRLDDSLAALGDVTGSFAARIEHVPGPDWTRAGHLADGDTRRAMDLLRDAIHLSTESLRAVERLLRQP